MVIEKRRERGKDRQIFKEREREMVWLKLPKDIENISFSVGSYYKWLAEGALPYPPPS